MNIYWLKIKDIVTETADVKTFLLERPEDLTWEEGAHTHFAMQGFNAGEKPNKSLVRHMSISTIPSEDAIGITTRIKEHCSEFKSILKQLDVGDEVALFGTHTHAPLMREAKAIYLLSSGVGLATFRSLALHYLSNAEGIEHMYSLNVDSSNQFLFTDIFNTDTEKNFTATFVNSRNLYYEQVQKLANDANGLYYIVGSDDFIIQTIDLLRENGTSAEQIVLDKREERRAELLSL